MIYLDKLTRKLQAVMSGAASSTNPKPVVCWSLVNNEGIESKGYTTISTLAGATDVDICAAPEVQSFVVHVKSIHICNIDNAAVTVTVKIDDSGTDTRLKTQALAVGESLVFTGTAGWQVF